MIYLLFWNQASLDSKRAIQTAKTPIVRLNLLTHQLNRYLNTRRYFCVGLLGMCFAKMRTNLVSSFDIRSNSADAIASMSSRCASN